MFTCFLYLSEYFKETGSEIFLATCVILITSGLILAALDS